MAIVWSDPHSGEIRQNSAMYHWSIRTSVADFNGIHCNFSIAKPMREWTDTLDALTTTGAQ